MKNMHRMLLVFHAEGKIPWSRRQPGTSTFPGKHRAEPMLIKRVWLIEFHPNDRE